MANLVWWELVRLARRGQTVRSRILLLYALLLALVVFAFAYPGGAARYFLGTATLPHADVAEFVRWLVFALLEAQLVLVALVTPAYAAGAIADEKDRGTLQLLFTTALTDREIVWGKAVARTLFVLAAVASGIPVLVCSTLLGSVDVGLIAVGYALTAGTVVLSAGIGVAAACHAPDSRTALIRAYTRSFFVVAGVLIPPFVLLSPFAVLFYYLEGASRMPLLLCGIAYPLVQATVACVLIAGAARDFRKAGATAGPPPPTAFPESPRGRPDPVLFEPPNGPPTARGELGAHDDPVLWKDRNAKGRPVPLVNVLTVGAAVLAAVLFVGGGWALVKRAVRALDPDEAMMLLRPAEPQYAGVLLMVAGVIASGLYLLPLAVGVTGCVAGERLRGTLDSLLATTLDRRRLLRAKVRACAEQGLAFAGGAAAALGAGFGTDGGVELGCAALSQFAGGVALVVGVGAWLSVRSATPVTAFRLCLPVLAAVSAMPVLVWYFTDWENPAAAAAALAWCGLAFLVAGAAAWWRAGRELERGEA